MTGMNTVNMRAEELYERGIRLKKYDAKMLRRRKYRKELAAKFEELYHLVSALRAALLTDGLFGEYPLLADEMQRYLFKNMSLLVERPRGYRKRLAKRLKEFHLTPLAFFTHRPDIKISVEEAMRHLRIYK